MIRPIPALGLITLLLGGCDNDPNARTYFNVSDSSNVHQFLSKDSTSVSKHLTSTWNWAYTPPLLSCLILRIESVRTSTSNK